MLELVILAYGLWLCYGGIRFLHGHLCEKVEINPLRDEDSLKAVTWPIIAYEAKLS